MIDRNARNDFQRIRLAQAGRVLPEPNADGGGIPAFVGQVTTSQSKIKVGSFLMVQPNFVLGQETEGASGSFTAVGSSTVPVYLLGPDLATTGDYLICKFVDNRWVAERTVPGSSGGGGSGGSGTVPFCSCTEVPTTLTMTSASETCNFGMFQSCTIVYGPVPPVYAPLGLGSEAFISTESFPDELMDGALFQYLLSCIYNQYTLTRIYPTSVYGSPYQDAVLYTWFTGSYGNTCNPFELTNGAAYPGSDASCFVTIGS